MLQLDVFPLPKRCLHLQQMSILTSLPTMILTKCGPSCENHFLRKVAKVYCSLCYHFTLNRMIGTPRYDQSSHYGVAFRLRCSTDVDLLPAQQHVGSYTKRYERYAEPQATKVSGDRKQAWHCCSDTTTVGTSNVCKLAAEKKACMVVTALPGHLCLCRLSISCTPAGFSC